MDPVLPKPDYLQDLEWYWPFAKFSLDPNDLFTTLHDRFNTRPFSLQDPTAFHRDVYECADSSDTRDEFYSRLEQRKAQRIKEMSKGWDEVSTLLWSSTLLSCQLCYDPETRNVKMKPGTKNDSAARRQFAFQQYARYMSFDNLVTFFDGFVRDEREERESMRRRADEAIERTRTARAARRAAAASEAIEATSSDSPRRASHGTARSKRKSSRNAPVSTSESPAAAAVAAEKPEPTSSSRRIGPRQADRLSPEQTAESSRAAKRRIDEDAPISTGKRRRMASEDVGAEDVDTERPFAGQDQPGVPEATPTPARRRKRKSLDDSLEEARKKKARMVDSPSERLGQSPGQSANQDQPGRALSSTESAVNTVDRSPSILSNVPDTTQIPEQYDDRAFLRARTAHQIMDLNRAFYIEELSQSPSERSSEIIHTNQEIPQADEDQLTRGLTTENSTTEADTKSPKRKLQKKPRASNRQRVDKRRSNNEQNPSLPKKQSRRKNPQERSPPASHTTAFTLHAVV
ncbi:uncharacterized protein TrAtP1_010834 [Trichoderma atroviride]|uniref:uncharacterized protein n=1 Tax=Hypocrea atroviridis TaxID=63577 RepID=UPI0033309D4F|nr:hypothetical protein TrAtP1_010834 [Trichoderma atroviride]